jgi:hypothetical protein
MEAASPALAGTALARDRARELFGQVMGFVGACGAYGYPTRRGLRA